MLDGTAPMAFVATVDLDRSLPFYRDTLGLAVVAADPYGAMLELGGAPVRINVVADHTPAPNTVFGFATDDVAAEVAALTARGVEMARYPGMDQDELGVWTAPDGAQVAWFADPDGNVVSLTGRQSNRLGSDETVADGGGANPM
ncbi:MAG: VOC family protein [Acidimicrobiales bacterium]